MKMDSQAIEDMCLVFLSDAAVTLASPLCLPGSWTVVFQLRNCADLPWLHYLMTFIVHCHVQRVVFAFLFIFLTVLHLYARLTLRIWCIDLYAMGCGCGFAWTVYAV